jgi:hypothetical protein
VSTGTYSLKDMASGEQVKLKRSELAARIKPDKDKSN